MLGAYWIVRFHKSRNDFSFVFCFFIFRVWETIESYQLDVKTTVDEDKGRLGTSEGACKVPLDSLLSGTLVGALRLGEGGVLAGGDTGAPDLPIE